MPVAEIRRESGGRPPSPLLLLAEGQRALFEGLTLRAARAWLARAPRGDGHGVIVLPGFTAGDGSTAPLRRYLKSLGYGAHPWLLGRNLGPRGDLRERLARRVDELHRRYGRPLSIVGWSLGGIYAREVAKALPGHVRQVITLGSPFADAGRTTHSSWLYERLVGTDSAARRAAAARLRAAPDVPCTAIYSRSDGVVSWESCLEREGERRENIPVPGSHFGLGVNPLVLYAIADRLSQPEGAWRPFERSGWRRRVYR